MKDNIKLLLKGFVVGLGKIIPGVSGAMLAITMGIYEQGLRAISNLFKEFKQHFKFLLLLGIGVVFAIILGSKVVVLCLDKYYLPTMLLFVGMIAGGIRPLFNEVQDRKVELKSILISVSVITLLIILSFLPSNTSNTYFTKSFSSFLLFFLSGIVDAAATVIPGISGTALLMILGYYNIIMSSFSDLLNINNLSNNLFVLIPFGLGTLFGIFVIAKIMNYLFSKYKVTTYYSIIGFAIASVLILLTQTFNRTYNLFEIIISLILLVIGYFIAQKLDK